MLIGIIKGVPHTKKIKWNQKKHCFFLQSLVCFTLVLNKNSIFKRLVG